MSSVLFEYKTPSEKGMIMKGKKRIAIIGHFGGKENFLDGQTIKTKVFYDEFKRIDGVQIKKVDTYYKNHNSIKLIWDFFRATLTCKYVIVLVAENGMKTLFPLLYFCSRYLKKRIYHSVIGASLAQRVVTYKNFKKYLNSFCVNWCETIGLVKKLHELGVPNAELLYNCKRLIPISENEIVEVCEKPHRLCTFSRVMCEKGIEDAIYAVKSINDKYAETVYTLDIYGQIDPEQTEWFEKLQQIFPSYIQYRGAISYDKSVDVLKDYFALLFPTRYWTEGVPGTIIDAYAAGLPVIASKWENFDNIIDKETGVGYDFNCPESLVCVLNDIQCNPKEFLEKKVNCIERYQEFSPDTIIKRVLQKIK